MERMPQSTNITTLEARIRERAIAENTPLTNEQVKLSADLISAKLVEDATNEDALIGEAIAIRLKAAESAEAVSKMRISPEDGTIERGA